MAFFSLAHQKAALHLMHGYDNSWEHYIHTPWPDLWRFDKSIF